MDGKHMNASVGTATITLLASNCEVQQDPAPPVPAIPPPIRVLIADDHAVVRSGLSTFLMSYDDLELVGSAADGVEAVRLCKELQPDVVLMDLSMPNMDGVEATKRIRAECPRCQVIALTSFREEEVICRALQAGAVGYQLKNIAADELAGVIRQAHEGRPNLAPEA